MVIFEVCVDNLISISNAFNGGADRLELCSALSEGGLTPTVGLLREARKATAPNFSIFVMIRPRGGNFIYSAEEVEVMKTDIKILKENGANGFVFGALTETNSIDVETCRLLLRDTSPLPVTFHRAFDEIKDWEGQMHALDELIKLGCSRLLTSGGCETVVEGLSKVSRLVEHSGGRIIVVPGAGVTPWNMKNILVTSGAVEIHGSAKGDEKVGGMVVTREDYVRQMKNIAASVEKGSTDDAN